MFVSFCSWLILTQIQKSDKCYPRVVIFGVNIPELWINSSRITPQTCTHLCWEEKHSAFPVACMIFPALVLSCEPCERRKRPSSFSSWERSAQERWWTGLGFNRTGLENMNELELEWMAVSFRYFRRYFIFNMTFILPLTITFCITNSPVTSVYSD